MHVCMCVSLCGCSALVCALENSAALVNNCFSLSCNISDTQHDPQEPRAPDSSTRARVRARPPLRSLCTARLAAARGRGTDARRGPVGRAAFLHRAHPQAASPTPLVRIQVCMSAPSISAELHHLEISVVDPCAAIRAAIRPCALPLCIGSLCTGPLCIGPLCIGPLCIGSLCTAITLHTRGAAPCRPTAAACRHLRARDPRRPTTRP